MPKRTGLYTRLKLVSVVHPLGSGEGRSVAYCTEPTRAQKRMGGETPTELGSSAMCDAERDWVESARVRGNRMKCDAKKRLLRENSKIFQPTFSVQNTAVSCRSCGQYGMVVGYKIRNDFV